jgi:hypothetical protein
MPRVLSPQEGDAPANVLLALAVAGSATPVVAGFAQQ